MDAKKLILDVKTNLFIYLLIYLFTYVLQNYYESRQWFLLENSLIYVKLIWALLLSTTQSYVHLNVIDKYIHLLQKFKQNGNQ